MIALVTALLLLSAEPPDDGTQDPAIRCESTDGGIRCNETLAVMDNDERHLDLRPVTSADLSQDDLRMLGPDTETLLSFALRSAGANVGRQQIFIEGLPADADVPAALISRIAVNADPFSVDNSGVDQIRVDVDLKDAPRRWGFDLAGLSFHAGGSDRLARSSAPQSSNFSAGLSGSIPGWPITFSVHGTRYSEAHNPVITSAETGAATADKTVTAGSDSASLAASVAYSTRRVRVRTMLLRSRSSLEHAGVGALVQPSAGSFISSTTSQSHTTWHVAGATWIQRGAISWRRLGFDSTANSTGPAVVVTAQRIDGSSDVTAEHRSSSMLNVRHVLESAGRGRPWLIGAELAHDGVADVQQPNPIGRLQLADPAAQNGTWFFVRGASATQASATSAAVFAQRTITDTRRLTLRTGARADWQAEDGTIVSPRATMRVLGPAGLQVGAGAGLFADTLSSALLIDVVRRDGSHGDYRVAPATAPFDPALVSAISGLPVTAALAPGFGRRRDAMLRAAVGRRFNGWDMAVEHTWTRGVDLAGSIREREPDRLVDVVASDRALIRHQTHARASTRWRRGTLTVHYEYAQSIDNTDGVFSFPADSDDLAGEWGPSVAVSRQSVGIVAAMTLPRAIRLSLAMDARSGRPFNAVTGRDAEGLATYTDRGGLPRNSGIGPSTRNVSAYLSRSVAAKGLRGLKIDVGVRVENLLNDTNAIAVGEVVGSPLFGRAINASPGRSIRVWVTTAR